MILLTLLIDLPVTIAFALAIREKAQGSILPAELKWLVGWQRLICLMHKIWNTQAVPAVWGALATSHNLH